MAERYGKRQVTLWLDNDLMNTIDELAVKADMTRTKLLQNIVSGVVPDLAKCDKLGLWRFSVILNDFLREGVKSWRQYVCDEPENVGVTKACPPMCED